MLARRTSPTRNQLPNDHLSAIVKDDENEDVTKAAIETFFRDHEHGKKAICSCLSDEDPSRASVVFSSDSN